MSNKKDEEKIVKNGRNEDEKITFHKVNGLEDIPKELSNLSLGMKVLGHLYFCYTMAIEKDMKDLGDKFNLNAFIFKFSQYADLFVAKEFPFLRKEMIDPLKLTKKQNDYTYSYMVNTYIIPMTIMLTDKYNVEHNGVLAKYLDEDEDGGTTIKDKPETVKHSSKTVVN